MYVCMCVCVCMYVCVCMCVCVCVCVCACFKLSTYIHTYLHTHDMMICPHFDGYGIVNCMCVFWFPLTYQFGGEIFCLSVN